MYIIIMSYIFPLIDINCDKVNELSIRHLGTAKVYDSFVTVLLQQLITGKKMQHEIEIKLIVSNNIEETLKDLSEKQDVKLIEQQFALENIYFDTPDKKLRQWDMGMRIRVNGEHIEQTIKTAGEVIGGLHQRPEYNIDIQSREPKLDLFPQQIWPKNTNLEQLSNEIAPLFATNFTRRGYMMVYPDGAVVEMVLDQGKIISGERDIDVCEVELELVKGKPELIFELAQALAQGSPMRFGVDSKAARGYMLAKGVSHQVSELTAVNLGRNDTLEQAYIKAINHGLAHWQRHIEVFIEQGTYQAIVEIRKALSLIIKANDIYSDYFQDDQLKQLTKALFWLVEELAFIDSYQRIEALLDNNGHKIKKLSTQEQVVELLATEQATMPNVANLIELFNSSQHTALVSRLMQWLFFKPWQQQPLPSLEKFQTKLLRKKAASLLDNDWTLIQQSLPIDSDMTYQDYLSQRFNLQHNLQVGLCVGEMFEESERLKFRAPWLDIIYGIDQLLQFDPIKQLLRSAKLVDEEGTTKKWLARKEESLLHAMEQSRKQALKLTPYWQE
ncbi:MAG: inorganic triphosphatase [Psychrobium sp.]